MMNIPFLNTAGLLYQPGCAELIDLEEEERPMSRLSFFANRSGRSGVLTSSIHNIYKALLP